MPLTNIFMKTGKSETHRAAICASISLALTETFMIPEDKRFMTVIEQDDRCFSFWQSYLGFNLSDDALIIQITHDGGCTEGLKKALFKRIIERLSTNPGIDPEDVFMSLVQVAREEWSFGDGAHLP